jgi:hypothetical protein
MTNEQIIYLGPEEELTSVRERLEGAQAERIMLVIPPQTQLRSHLGWRLLHSRMRELGKDVLVISSDRQIRTVAQNAGFRVADAKVADAKESSASNKQRPASRQVRTDVGGKTIQRSRNQPGRGRPSTRFMWSKQQSQSQLAANDQQQAPQSRGEKESKISRADEAITGSGAAASSTFEIHDEQFAQPYESHMETPPSIHSQVPEHEDDEFDPLKAGVYIEDLHVAQHIREAAQSTDTGVGQPAPEVRELPGDRPEQQSMLQPAGEMDEDPFAYMEDIQPVSLPEQRASTFIHDLDPGIPDISEVPTEVQEAEIEYLGDEGEIGLQQDSLSRAWAEPVPEEPYEAETPRGPGVRPRHSVGNLALPSLEDLDDQDKLPPPERPARATPSPGALSSAALASSTAGRRQPKPQAQARNVTVPPTTQQARKPAATKGSRNVAAPPVSRATPSTSSHKGSRIMAIAFISLVVIVLALLAFLYFGSNATVTITVPTQTLSLPQPVQYEASTNRQDTQHNTIPSQVLTYTVSAMGQGTATGTIKQGNSSATGTVIFTNNGSQPLDIPTGTVIATSGPVAVQFVTTANVHVEPASNGIPVPPVQVLAQNSGDSGNVAANAISIILPDSITTIATYNNIPKTSVILTVTNPSPTSGGGALNVKSVTSSDINALEKTLHQQVQNQIKDWLAKVVHATDVKGTLMPDVLGSSTLLKEEKLVTTPTVGQAAPNGNFNGVLSVTVSLLVIRDTAIQAAGRAQLNAIALKMKPAFVLATQRPVNVTVTKSSPSPDGKTLSITVTASGQIMQRVSAKAIRNLVAGKSVDQAKSMIKSGAGINNVLDPRIDIFPPLLGIMPFRPEQIHVIVQPGPSSSAPNG